MSQSRDPVRLRLLLRGAVCLTVGAPPPVTVEDEPLHDTWICCWCSHTNHGFEVCQNIKCLRDRAVAGVGQFVERKRAPPTRFIASPKNDAPAVLHSTTNKTAGSQITSKGINKRKKTWGQQLVPRDSYKGARGGYRANAGRRPVGRKPKGGPPASSSRLPFGLSIYRNAATEEYGAYNTSTASPRTMEAAEALVAVASPEAVARHAAAKGVPSAAAAAAVRAAVARAAHRAVHSESPVQQQLPDNTAEERPPLAMLPALYRLVEPGHRSPPPHRSRTVSPSPRSSPRLRAASPSVTREVPPDIDLLPIACASVACAPITTRSSSPTAFNFDENDANTTTSSHHQDLLPANKPNLPPKLARKLASISSGVSLSPPGSPLGPRRMTSRNNSFNDLQRLAAGGSARQSKDSLFGS